MVGDVLKVIDYIIEILKKSATRRRQTCIELLNPLFDDLLLVHKNYIDMFESTRKLLPGYYSTGRSIPGFDGTPGEGSEEYLLRLRTAKEDLRRRRREFEPVRIKIRALHSTLDLESLEEQERAFVESVIHYLPDTETRDVKSISHRLLHYLDSLDNGGNEEFESQVWNELEPTIDTVGGMESYIREVIYDHVQKWSDVCKSYAALKVKTTHAT